MRPAAVGLLLTALSSGLVSSQRQTMTSDDALRIMRDVATAEVADASQTKKGFADLEHVLNAAAWRDPNVRTRSADLAFRQIDQVSAIVLDYTLRLTLSTDRKHFDASLTHTSGGCAPAWFVDERSVIHTGKALDCK